MCCIVVSTKLKLSRDHVLPELHLNSIRLAIINWQRQIRMTNSNFFYFSWKIKASSNMHTLFTLHTHSVVCNEWLHFKFYCIWLLIWMTCQNTYLRKHTNIYSTFHTRALHYKYYFCYLSKATKNRNTRNKNQWANGMESNGSLHI